MAVSALFACNKEISVPEDNNGVKLVKFSTTPITKTVFGTPDGTEIPTLWTNSHTVDVSLNLGECEHSSSPVVGSGGKTATFSVEIASDDSGNYNFYALSPSEAVEGVSSSDNYFEIIIPDDQTSSATSPDELAQIVYAKKAAGSTFPSSVTMEFNHVTAYGRIKLLNLALDGGDIYSVCLVAEENWAGNYYYYAEDNSPHSAGDLVENSATNTILVRTDRTENIWFGCAPVDLGGKHIDVIVYTSKGVFSKKIEIPDGKKFESGKVSAFNVDMIGISPASISKDLVDIFIGSVDTSTGLKRSLPEYNVLDLEITHNAYWHSASTYFADLQIEGHGGTAANLQKFAATKRFTRADDIPNGTVIVLKKGYSYRPDKWINLETKNNSKTRPGDVSAGTANNIAVVDDEWWGSFNYVGFNIAKVSGTLENMSELDDVLAVFVPKP